MTIDREQIRRDADSLATLPAGTNQGRLARYCIALLDELELAEQKRDAWQRFAESNLEAIKRLEAAR